MTVEKKGKRARPRPDAVQGREQFVADRVHLSAVEGIPDPEEPAKLASLFEQARRALERPDLRPRSVTELGLFTAARATRSPYTR